MTTGEKIAAQRRKAGLSQEALAERLGISRQAVSRWETNESLPDTERIIQLSRILGISTDYLLLEEQAADEVSSAKTPAPATSAVPLTTHRTAAGLFRLCGVSLSGGGAVISLTSLVLIAYQTMNLTRWGDHGRLGTVLRRELSGAGLFAGLLLMLIGILLLAVDFFLRKRP